MLWVENHQDVFWGAGITLVVAAVVVVAVVVVVVAVVVEVSWKQTLLVETRNKLYGLWVGLGLPKTMGRITLWSQPKPVL